MPLCRQGAALNVVVKGCDGLEIQDRTTNLNQLFLQRGTWLDLPMSSDVKLEQEKLGIASTSILEPSSVELERSLRSPGSAQTPHRKRSIFDVI